MPTPKDTGKSVRKAQNGRFVASDRAKAEKSREIADNVRKTRGTFDRDKFDKFVDNNPLLSKLHLLSDSDD
jgi:hypothetical protein